MGSLVVGAFQVLLATSLAALIFGGPLAPFVGRGLGFVLVGTILAGMAVATIASVPGTVGGTQNAPAAILAVVSAGIAAGVAARGGTAEVAFVTTVVAATMASLATGLFLLALGRFRLGNLVRFLPVPVIGGFVAGTGWLLVVGAIGVMTGRPVAFTGPEAVHATAQLVRWMPGAALAVLLLVALARSSHVAILPSILAGAIAAFYGVAWAVGASFERLVAGGWTAGPFPGEELWAPLSRAELALVDWGLLVSQAATVATVLPVAAVAVLLNAGGLEVATRREIDLDRELRATGLASLLSGLASGPPPYQQLGVTILGRTIGIGGRPAALLAVAVAALALVAGGDVLSAIPRFLLGGLLMYIGLGFLKEWLYDGWFRLPRLDFAIVATIVVAIATLGFLQGVGLGVVAAVVLFAATYSRIDVVRHERSGRHARSRVTRAARERGILDEQGPRIHVFDLHGYLFFGTGHLLVQRVRDRLARDPVPDVLILDFRRVTGVDSTAAAAFAKLRRVAGECGAALQYASVPERLRPALAGDDPDGVAAVPRFAADADDALEWAEERILRDARDEGADEAPPASLEEHLQALVPGAEAAAAIVRHTRRRTLAAGALLLRQGEPSEAMYFVESGLLSARLERPDAEPIRLQTMGGGNVLGELGLFLDRARSATVAVVEDAVVHELRRDDLARMERDDPAAALALHRLVVRLLAERTTHLMGAVQALEE